MKSTIREIVDFIFNSKKSKHAVKALAMLVVFVTTYMLILPAFTLEKDEAVRQGGIDVPAAEASAGETNDGDDGQSEKDAEAVTEDKTEDKDEAKTGAGGETENNADSPSALAAQSDPLTFEGDGFTISVDDKRSVLPDNTEVVASELLEKPVEGTKAERKEAEEAYKKYYDLAHEAVQDDSASSISFVKFYDISLQSAGEDVQPDKPVNVTISYNKDQQKELKVEEKKNVRIIHFAEDKETGEITAEILKDDSVDVSLRQKKMEETTFEAESFSVYAVVNVTDVSSIVSSGTKYALVTGIANDPGATTGYHENWGQDYFTIIVNAHAMSDRHFYNQGAVDGLSVDPVHAYEDGSISYVGGDPVQWQFESAGNGKYYLSANGKYLQRYKKDGDDRYGWEARLVEDRSQATALSITVNNDGTVLIYDDLGGDQKYYLHNDGDGEWNTRVFKFKNQNVDTSSQAYRFRLCTKSEEHDSFAAKKVSVQDLRVNDSFLIYRKFEDNKGNELLFALASDGTFVRVYDGGDTLYWRETDKNLLWNYRLEGNYYSIYSTDPATDETVYINPMHSSEPARTITSEPSRLTLIGKDRGDYGTSLENWDQKAYDYAGLHVTVNDQGEAVLSTGTRVAGTSDEFLFAVAGSMPGETAETVDTVDSDSLGIKITMFDYGQAEGNYSAGDKLSEMTAVAGSDEYTPHAAHQLVKSYLENGLPSSTANGAMTGLFTGTGSAVTAYKENVNHLFLQSYYDENGTFRYRSEDNYAYLPYDADTQTITDNDFVVYRQAATPYPDDTAPGHTYYTHGHFMPYNDINMEQNVSRLMNQYGNEYHDGVASGEIPVGDGRTYEDIYGVQGTPNFYTGMKMEASFTQPRGGKLENGDPMVFKFTGDDDMWVYIDGVLVLDIGGIHEPLSGTINFATGEVTNPNGSSLQGSSNLKTIFTNALADLQRIPEGQRTQEQRDLITKIQNIQWNGNTFADYSNHDFKAFYMERGAGASNLDIQFNLKVVRTDEFTVEKQIPDEIDARFVNQEYKFQATYKDSTDADEVKPLYAGAKNRAGNDVCTAVYYRDRKDENGDPVPVQVDRNGYFTLKAGEAAVFKLGEEDIEYTVKEVEIDSALTEKVEINDQVAEVSSGTAAAAYARVSDRSRLNYKNHPYLQNLDITKHLLPEGAKAGAGDVFEFRVYLETATEVDGETVQQLVPYSYGPYYVTKMVEGQLHYYTLTGENNAPEDKGTSPVVCSTTGRSGSINSIPPEYTVVIPNLAIGTHFYIEERRDNIPAGYVFDHEDLIPGTYDTQTLGTDQDIISRILARDEKDHQSFDPDTIGKIKRGKDAESEIFNRKVYVNVKKQWLKTNGEPYTLEEARALPGSTGAVVTAELWKKKAGKEASGDPVTVTFMVNTTADTAYRQVSTPVRIRSGSALEFSLGANKTSQATEIHSNPQYSISRSSVSSNPKITYSNGRQKEKWSKYTISSITANTTVYATFDASKVSDDFVGLYIASMEEPGSSEAAEEEKVADITLNNGNDWLEQFSYDPDYTYFLMNVEETGLGENAHRYTFIDAPTVTTDADGNLTLAVANKYREPIDVTVEKEWAPALSAEEEAGAYVTVELHRYAKKTKGVLDVVLKDNYGAPIEGAKFKLFKDGVAQEQEYVTDVNGKVAANNLEPGTYYFKQISTPAGYSMSDSAPQTEAFVVEDNKTVPQEKHCELRNQALETNGVATLTLVDNNGNPIKGAKYKFIKKDGGSEEIIHEALETDANGQITVSQLKAGTYYFFEIEPPADYKLPDSWQDTDFTVHEQPGAVQHFDIRMTNDLKGKGYIDITLTGPENAPISGAKFELYKAEEKLEEGTTGEDGKLSFGDSNRLAVGTYIVKQVTTDDDLLPANQQSFTIEDNGNINQQKELTFTNPYRGKGTASITLTRKDTGEPISGATFELYKDGEMIAQKTTDDEGELTFGDPKKLDAGSYSVKQTTTVDGLEPVVNNWSFTVLENGDRNQTYSWNVQNEENAGNVTIKLWRKGGTGQWNWGCLNTYTDLKPGRTYSFTATADAGLYPNNIWYYQDESDHVNADSISTDQCILLNADDWDNGTYHFTITPEKDNTVYSFVLVSGWGRDNIKTMEMDESSRQAAAPAANSTQSSKALKLSAPTITLLGAAEEIELLAQNALNDAVSPDGDAKAAGEEEQADVSGSDDSTSDNTSAQDTTVSPSDPPSDEYIVDSGFTETYTIKKADDWKHVFEDLDKTDQDENLYYYYVVETECVPATYHLAAYTGDNLSETGTIKVTNRQKPGALTIEKKVTVNGGAVPDAAKTIADGDYTFTVTGPDNYSNTVTVKINQGVAASTTLSGLTPGEYTITETATTNRNGINLVTEPVVLNVAANSQATANVASFTNDLETTSIKVKKQWMDENGRPVNNTSSVITFTLNQVSYINDSDPNHVEVPYAGTYTNQIVGNGEVEITNLPVKGTRDDGTPVFYAYTISENQDSVPGYHGTYGTSDDGKEWTIYNTPVAGTDQSDSLSVTKQWQDMNGNPNNNAHSDDEITFTVTRHAVATTDYVPVTLSLYNSDSPGQAAQVKTYFVKKNSNITLTFYNRDSRHFLTLSGAGSADDRYIGEDRTLAVYDYEAEFRVNGPMSLSAQISDRAWALIGTGSRIHDTWVDKAGKATALPPSTKWDYSISATGSNSIFDDAKKLADYLKNGTPLDNQPTYTYTMKGGNQITEGTAFNPQASDWVATLSELPIYVKVGDHYETYTYTISEVKVNGKTVNYSSSNANQGNTDDYLVTLDPENNTIINKEKPVTVEFTKRWLDVAEQVESWPDQAITVTVKGESSGGTTEYVYKIEKTDVTDGATIPALQPNGAPALKVESTTDNNYTFKLENLPRTDSDRNAITYTISETDYPEGYQPPKYYDSNGDPIGQGGTAIESGGSIENAVATYELPHTGGIGTTIFYILGSILVIGGGIYFVSRRRMK